MTITMQLEAIATRAAHLGDYDLESLCDDAMDELTDADIVLALARGDWRYDDAR